MLAGNSFFFSQEAAPAPTGLCYYAETHDCFEDGSTVATYQLNGNANDLGGTYNGTPTNITYTDGRFGQAGVFDGTTSFIDTGISTLTGSISASAWVKPDAVGTKCIYYLNSDDKRIDIFAESTLSNSVTVSNNNIFINFTGFLDGNYHFIHTNYNPTSGEVSVYINGILHGTVTSVPFSQADSIRIGKSGGAYFFDGNIDQVRIFNRALTHDEVRAIYTERVYAPTADTHDVFEDVSAVATYQLNGDATDLGGTYNSTPFNMTYTDGIIGQAGFFNPTATSHIDTNYVSNDVGTTKSYSFWFKTTYTGTLGRCIMSKGGSNVTEGWAIRVGYSTANVLVFATSGVGVSLATGSTVISDGEWHHGVVVTSFAPVTTTTMYIDGKLESLTYNTAGGDMQNSLQTFKIGKFANVTTADYFFSGDIDQVRIFNRALTHDEVRQLYVEQKIGKDAGVHDFIGDSSIVATYQLNGNANDLGGTYNGTPTNITYSDGFYGQAAVFNGASSSILTGIQQGLSAFTWSIWIKSATLTTQNFAFPIGIFLAGTSHQFFIRVDSGQIQIGGYDGAAKLAGATAVNDTWFHCVLVNDGSNISGYVNAEQILAPTAHTINVSTNQTIMGAIQQFGNTAEQGWFSGSSDQCRIFNRALTQQEIVALYNEHQCYLN